MCLLDAVKWRATGVLFAWNFIVTRSAVLMGEQRRTKGNTTLSLH